MYRVVVIDDEQHIRDMIVEMFKEFDNMVVVGSCASVEEGKVLINSCNPDIVCLDIKLSDGTGFNLLEQIEAIDFKLIFITSYSEHAIKAIKYGAFDYILKPIDEDELGDTIKRICADDLSNEMIDKRLSIAKKSDDDRDQITLRFANSIRIVDYSDIIYCKSESGYTFFYLKNGEELLCSRGLKYFADLLDDKQFIRVHKSFLVNRSYVQEYHNDGVLILKNKIEIPVATRRKDLVLSIF